MNLKFIFLSVKKYGISGIVSFLKRKIFGDSLSRFLHAHASSTITPQKGVTIIGCIDGPTSLSKVLRDFAILLKKADVPLQVLNNPCEKPIPKAEYEHLLTPVSEFVTNKYTEIVTMEEFFKIADRRCRVNAIEFWELEEGFKEAHPEATNIKNLIAMSDFNLDVFRKEAPNANVRKILYPFQFFHGPLASVAEVRRRYGIPADAFAVFFNFAFQSSYHRKNPEGILRAFSQVFSSADNAVIVFKTMHAKKCTALNQRLHALADELGLANRLITIDDFIPQEDLVNLTNACDVYMSLHRGEGFGLGIAEAMTLAKPVIVTDYSATTEFCTAANALLIPYKMVEMKPEQRDVSAYDAVTQWAEPDIDTAAKALRRLYDDPALRRRMGESGRKTIQEHFSIDNFRKSIEAFLAG